MSKCYKKCPNYVRPSAVSCVTYALTIKLEAYLLNCLADLKHYGVKYNRKVVTMDYLM